MAAFNGRHRSNMTEYNAKGFVRISPYHLYSRPALAVQLVASRCTHFKKPIGCQLWSLKSATRLLRTRDDQVASECFRKGDWMKSSWIPQCDKARAILSELPFWPHGSKGVVGTRTHPGSVVPRAAETVDRFRPHAALWHAFKKSPVWVILNDKGPPDHLQPDPLSAALSV